MLSLTTFFVDASSDTIAARLDLSCAILLTAVAFKSSTSAYLPQISYLTLIDKFVLLNLCMIIFATLLHALLGFLTVWVDVGYDRATVINQACFVLNSALWLGIQVWFSIRANGARKVQKGYLLQRSMARRRSFTPTSSTPQNLPKGTSLIDNLQTSGKSLIDTLQRTKSMGQCRV